MKKKYALFCVLLCLSVVLSFTGCKGDGDGTDAPAEETTEAVEEVKDPESAEELWERIDETMDAVSSYEGKSVGQFVLYNSGYKFDMAIIGDSLICRGDENYEYAKSTLDMSCAELGVSEKQENIKAYYDGRMYYYNVCAEYTQAFFSEMTYEEYGENDESLTEEIDLLDCTEQEFGKAEDGGWELSFSGYTKKTMNSFLDGSGMDSMDMGADIVDMEVSVYADAELRATKIRINMIFDCEDEDAEPVMAVEYEYSSFNEAEPNIDELDIGRYTEIADVRMLEKVEGDLNEFKNAASGSFSFDIEQTVTAMGESNVNTERDDVSFQHKNNGYTFDIRAEGTDGDITISYAGGVETVLYNGEEHRVPMTDDEAKAIVDDLIDSARYDPDCVSNVEKIGDDVYVFTMGAPDETKYVEVLQSIGVEFESISQTITVTMKDGKVYKMVNEVQVQGAYHDVASVETVELALTGELVFGQIEQDGVSV